MNTIPLKEFITSVLVDLASGVADANLKMKETKGVMPFIINSSQGDSHKQHKGIEFDIAVTASEDRTTTSGVGVALVSIGAGAKAQSAAEASTTHRIRFEICTRYTIE
jgi:uncharacterized RmlC-like cupin family protein